jgi:hypothetical protein
MLTGTETDVRRAGREQGAANQWTNVGQAVGCRWPSRDSVCRCMAPVFTWGERKFHRRSGRGRGKPFFVSIPAMSSGCVI